MPHDPETDFVQHLEWQLRTAVRRRSRFARPIPSVPVRALRTALLVLLCLFGGAGAVLAAERIQDQERKQHLVAKLELELEMARVRLHHEQARYEQADGLVQAGLASQGELEQRRTDLFEAENAVFERELDLEEVRATGRAPRHDLGAPLVGGRDLVGLRLQRRREVAQRRLHAVADQIAHAERLVEAGVMASHELAGQRAQVELAHADVELMERRMEIRAAFVAGEHSAEQVDLLERIAVARHALQHGRLRLHALSEKLELARELTQAGVASGEVRPLELELELARRELELHELELGLLEQRLRDR